MKAKVDIFLRQDILDPQGKTIESSLKTLGFEKNISIRQGKFFYIEIDTTDQSFFKEQIEQMCKKLLVNPVMEDYRVTILS